MAKYLTQRLMMCCRWSCGMLSDLCWENLSSCSNHWIKMSSSMLEWGYTTLYRSEKRTWYWNSRQKVFSLDRSWTSARLFRRRISQMLLLESRVAISALHRADRPTKKRNFNLRVRWQASSAATWAPPPFVTIIWQVAETRRQRSWCCIRTCFCTNKGDSLTANIQVKCLLAAWEWQTKNSTTRILVQVPT